MTREEAKSAGLKRYSTGKPCLRGHVSERLVSDKACCQCRTERNQTSEFKAKHAAYRRLTAENIAAYYQANREKISATKAAYRQQNREEVAAKKAAYRQQNPHIYAAMKAKRRAAKLQATPPWVDFKTIRAIYKQCAERTKTTGIPHAVDHIYPLVSNAVCGLHVAANLQILTASENSSKHNKLPAPEQIPSELE